MFTTTQQPHWTKNPIVWMVIFFPSLAVVAGFYTLYLAIESDDGLVDSNYYKEGLGINKTIGRDLNAIERKISGLISINAQTGSVQTKFANDLNTQELNFKLVHRTIPGFDQHITLTQVEGTLLYTGDLKPLPEKGGRWRWEITHDNWRISERFTTKIQETIIHSFPKKEDS